jgi:hypothetical protein
MNYWTKLSAQHAAQKDYLDSLLMVYPMSPNFRRELSNEKLQTLRDQFEARNNVDLIRTLLDLEIFPLKDSYVAYLKRDNSSILRNPRTIERLAENLYNMGLDSIIEKSTEPKETNRQIGPLFKRWISTNTLGAKVFDNIQEFINYNGDALLNSSDKTMSDFCKEYLGYNHDKGIDFIARFNHKYIIGEAKFLTDFGGHQNAQFNDAIATIDSILVNPKIKNEVIKIAILDGVLYIKGKNKMYKYLESNPDKIILSTQVLGKFLLSL